MSRYRAALAALAALALLAQAPLTAWAQEPAPEPGKARLLGRVLDTDGKPVRGASIVAYHLSSAQTFSSAETDSQGEFEMTGLPYGYFDVAVKSPSGLFVTDEVVNLPPAGKVAMTLTLVPGGTGATEPRGFAGLDETAVGIAQVGSRKTGGQFLKSPTGLAVLGGIGGALLLGLALSGGDDDEIPVSPTNPQ